VMEYVDGVPINIHCDQNRLSIRQRLALFVKVCKAVQFAHHNLVIHRDLKPRNILVDGFGNPRLLDFGIAKFLDSKSDESGPAEAATTIHAMTTVYASPEQIRGTPLTTATDAYSLGVVLYELLTGQIPYDVNGKSNYEIGRIICQQEVVAPSLVVTRHRPPSGFENSAEVLSAAALTDARGETPDSLQRRLRGDLDNILMMALRKNASSRYPSVEALGDDLQRYLKGLPVQARRQTLTYRTLKLMNRNKAVTVISVLLLLSFIAGLIGVTTGFRAALKAQEDTQAVTDYLQGVFSNANPYRNGREVTVAEQLQAASMHIDRDLSQRPVLEANVHMSIARTYVGMWMWKEAVPHLRRALQLTRELYGPNDARVADVLSLLGRSLAFLAQPESIVNQQEALRIREECFGLRDQRVAESRASLGFAIWQTQPQRIRESIQMYRDSLGLYDRLGLRMHPDVGRFTFGLAVMLSTIGDANDADEAYQKAIRVYKSLREGHDRYLTECMNRYASFLAGQNRFDEAETVLRDSMGLTPSCEDAIGPMAPYRILSDI